MGVTVFAPASVANLAVGYDCLGLCLDGPGDEVYAEFSDKRGISIKAIEGADGKLPLDPLRNTAGKAALDLLAAYGDSSIGVALTIRKKMPFGSGLGSSSASAVGGALAVNELLGCPFTKRELLPFAVAGEQVADGAWHADNVAPSLLGGIVLIRDNASLDVLQLRVPSGLRVCVIHPNVEVLTRDSRSVLKPTVSLNQMIQQQSNLAGFIVGLYQDDLDLIRRSMHDVTIEPQRAHLIPHFAELKSSALEAGALACSISGAGPSVFALCSSDQVANEVGVAMKAVLSSKQVGATVYQSTINEQGARRYL